MRTKIRILYTSHHLNSTVSVNIIYEIFFFLAEKLQRVPDNILSQSVTEDLVESNANNDNSLLKREKLLLQLNNLIGELNSLYKQSVLGSKIIEKKSEKDDGEIKMESGNSELLKYRNSNNNSNIDSNKMNIVNENNNNNSDINYNDKNYLRASNSNIINNQINKNKNDNLGSYDRNIKIRNIGSQSSEGETGSVTEKENNSERGGERGRDLIGIRGIRNENDDRGSREKGRERGRERGRDAERELELDSVLHGVITGIISGK